jgi:pimeloyl-ACP methyl ester carboxylesterase
VRFKVDGQEIDHEARGEDGGRPLVFLHGLTTDRRLPIETFEPVFADRPGWRRIYLDLPGHGLSTGNLVGASADGLISCVAKLAREVGGGKPALVAHSYGGYLALGVARALGEVDGLFLVNPIVEPDLQRRVVPPQRFVVVEEGLVFADDEQRATFDAEVAVHSRATLEAFRRAVDPGHRAANRPFVQLVRNQYAQSRPWSPALANLDRPVSVVCGRDDYWAGYTDALDLVKLARRCRYSVLPGCGHLLPIEAAPTLRALFLDWLEELGR